MERRSWGAAFGVAALHALVGYALLAGWGRIAIKRATESPLVVVNVMPPPPPERPPPKAREPDRRKAAPAAPKRAAPAKPAPVPVPIAPAPVPLVPVAPAAPPRGGGGTVGGSGSGGGGEGTGEGGGEGISPARQTGGRFRNSDFPASARAARRLRIGVRYEIGPTGHVDRCEVIDPSGYPEVDAMTCRVIVDRYRFKPARDARGTAIREVREEDYSWVMD